MLRVEMLLQSNISNIKAGVDKPVEAVPKITVDIEKPKNADLRSKEQVKDFLSVVKA